MTSKKELVIWHEFDGQGDTSIQVLEELCEEYSQEHGIQVTPEVMNISELVYRLKHISIGGQVAHMALVPADMAVLEETAWLSKVPEELSHIVRDFGNNDLASMQVDEIQYGLPVLKGNHMVLYYNREIFQVPPSSWEEIEHIGETLKQQGIVPLAADLEDPYWFIPFFTAFEGWPIEEGKPAILNDKMKQALHFVSDQLEIGFLANMNGSTELLERFIAGEVGAIICGEWIFNYLDQQMGARLGVGNLPSIQGILSRSMSSSIGLVFPNYSLNPDAEMREETISFAKFMLSEESQRKWGTKVQRIPVHPEIQEQLIGTYSPNRADLVNLLKHSRPLPIEYVMNRVWIALGLGLKELVEKGANVAFSTMEQSLQEAIQVDSTITTN